MEDENHGEAFVNGTSYFSQESEIGFSDEDNEENFGEVFINQEDIMENIEIDEEDLPDADEDSGSDADAAINQDDDSVHLFTGHSDPIYTCACSPREPTLVATGGGDNKGFLWNIGEGHQPQELLARKNSVSSLAFSSDGKLLASGGFDGLIQVWDIDSRKIRCILDGPQGSIEWVRWHPRGHLLLAGSDDFTVWLWNADNGSYLNIFCGHEGTVTCGDFTPDGKIICTASDDASLRIWNPKSGESIHVVKGHPYHTGKITCLTLSSDSAIAITGSEDCSVHIVNIKTGKVLSSLLAHSNSVEGAQFSLRFPWVATGSLDKKLIVWDIQHSMARGTCEHEAGVSCLTWLGASQYIATGCLDGKVLIWDCCSGNCVKVFNGHSDTIQALSISSDGKFLVSTSDDKTTRVFEIAEFQ